MAALSGVSAGAELLQRGLELEFAGASSIMIPQLATPSAANVGWVGEGQPIPVRELDSLDGPTLEPRKLAVLTVLSSEMISGSNAEALVRATLTASAALQIDETLFDTTAGDGVSAPPGCATASRPRPPAPPRIRNRR